MSHTFHVRLGPGTTTADAADYTLEIWYDETGNAVDTTGWSWTHQGGGTYHVTVPNMLPEYAAAYWLRHTAAGTPWTQGQIQSNARTEFSSVMLRSSAAGYMSCYGWGVLTAVTCSETLGVGHDVKLYARVPSDAAQDVLLAQWDGAQWVLGGNAPASGSCLWIEGAAAAVADNVIYITPTNGHPVVAFTPAVGAAPEAFAGFCGVDGQLIASNALTIAATADKFRPAATELMIKNAVHRLSGYVGARALQGFDTSFEYTWDGGAWPDDVGIKLAEVVLAWDRTSQTWQWSWEAADFAHLVGSNGDGTIIIEPVLGWNLTVSSDAVLGLCCTGDCSTITAGTLVLRGLSGEKGEVRIKFPAGGFAGCVFVGPDGELWDHDNDKLVVAADAAASGGGAALGDISDLLDAKGYALQATLLGALVPGTLQASVTTAVGTPLRVTRGDVSALTFTTARNLTGGKRAFFAAKKDKASATTAIVNRECTVTDAATGVCTITLTAAETATAGGYYWDLEIVDADGTSNPSTAQSGRLLITDDVRK